MKNIFFSQYDKAAYPLKKFTANEIPDTMKKILCIDENFLNGAVRGGLAYVLFTKSADYVLSDIDLIYPHSSFEPVVEFYSHNADYVFVNHNTFSDTVVTAFWQNGDTFYKADALILEKLPLTNSIEWENHILKIVDGFFLWCDRLQKISQRFLRGHTEQKTRNHILVAKRLAEYLYKEHASVPSIPPCDLEQLVLATVKVAEEFLTPLEASTFSDLQKKLLRKMEP